MRLHPQNIATSKNSPITFQNTGGGCSNAPMAAPALGWGASEGSGQGRDMIRWRGGEGGGEGES